MQVEHKNATLENTDEAGPGAFRVILSTETKDRDGDELKPTEWKKPLPDHITFDSDHGMSVATTIGSGHPYLNEKGMDGTLLVPEAPEGALIVEGTYSTIPRAQEVRTLVGEGHIRTTSVAFTNSKTVKDGVTSNVRELLNGAFVAIPANPEAVVLASKGLKSGARNSAKDAEQLQHIHDAAVSLGATCTHPAAKDRSEDDEDADTRLDPEQVHTDPPIPSDDDVDASEDEGADEADSEDNKTDEEKALSQGNELLMKTISLTAGAVSE